MGVCAAFDPLAPYVPTVMAFVDCHARALGEDGYRALGFGSPIGMAIRGFVTIYIALIGYRMLFGDLPQIRDIALAAVKIGAVLSLATQWPAYQVLVYNIVVDEPAALAERIFPAGGLGGEDVNGLTLRLQGVYNVLEAMVHPQPGGTFSAAEPSAPVDGNTSNAQSQPTLRRSLSLDEAAHLGGAEGLLLVSTLGGLLATRVVAAVLLALGPLFIGFFLFDATRGIFVGWVRALAATVIASVGVLATLGIGLALLEPQVTALYKTLEDGYSVPTLVGEVSATIGLVALLIATSLVGTGIAAFGLRLPDGIRLGAINFGNRLVGSGMTERAGDPVAALFTAQRTGERSRAQLVADAVGAQDRRDDARAAGATAVRLAVAGSLDNGGASRVAQPIGQGPNRTTRRYSSSARQRDNAV